jgi:hypothetical protein
MNNKPKISEILSSFEKFPYELEKTLSSFSEEELNMSYKEGGWSVKKLVHHLADAQTMGFMRFKWILTEEKTHIKLYDQDRWAELSDYSLPLEIPLTILKGIYAKWYKLISELKTEELAKKTYHPERGDMTLFDILAIYTEHGKKHLEHIKSVKA